jgi:hypothetical protein
VGLLHSYSSLVIPIGFQVEYCGNTVFQLQSGCFLVSCDLFCAANYRSSEFLITLVFEHIKLICCSITIYKLFTNLIEKAMERLKKWGLGWGRVMSPLRYKETCLLSQELRIHSAL